MDHNACILNVSTCFCLISTRIKCVFNSFHELILGWADDSIFIRSSDQEPGGEGWKQNGSSSVNAGAFTTGRGRPARVPPPIKPRSQMVSYSTVVLETIACIGVQQIYSRISFHGYSATCCDFQFY